MKYGVAQDPKQNAKSFKKRKDKVASFRDPLQLDYEATNECEKTWFQWVVISNNRCSYDDNIHSQITMRTADSIQSQIWT